MKKIILFVICFFANMLLVNASCDYTRVANLKKIASNVNITYDYKIVDNKAYFDITFANLKNDIYIYDSFHEKAYFNDGEVTIRDFESGISYRFFIKSNDSSCKDDILFTKYVNLPKYNMYYGDPLCEGIEDYTLCQRWGSYYVSSYAEYKEQIMKYKESLNKKTDIKDNKNNKTLKDIVFDFLLDYYYIILIVIIVICMSIIIYKNKKDRFDF